MSTWNTKPLGDVCVVNPKLTGDEVPSPGTEVSFVPMAAVDETFGEIVDCQTRTYQDVARGYTSFRNGDVLFAKITPCMENGKTAIASDLVNDVGFGSTEFHVLRPGSEVLSEWVHYFVRQPSFRSRAEANFTGSAGQRRVPTDFMRRIEIPVPPLDEQERIVKLLDEADALRKLRAEADRRMAELVPALFYEMFGDRDFPKVPLCDIAEVVSGVAKGGKRTSALVEAPYLRVANVQNGFLNLSEIKTILATPGDIAALELRRGDVLLTEGGDFDKLGRGAILETDLPGCIHQNHVFRVRVREDRLNSYFLAGYLTTPEARAYFLSCAKRTTNLASINLTQLRRFPVPLPAMELQERYEAERSRISRLQRFGADSKNLLIQMQSALGMLLRL